MIPKSGYRFSEKDHSPNNKLERDDDSKKSHPALAAPSPTELPMVHLPWLWAAFTIIAAAAQTVRNAMQRELTATLGTVSATHVRFLFGFPFALAVLAGVLVFT